MYATWPSQRCCCIDSGLGAVLISLQLLLRSYPSHTSPWANPLSTAMATLSPSYHHHSYELLQWPPSWSPCTSTLVALQSILHKAARMIIQKHKSDPITLFLKFWWLPAWVRMKSFESLPWPKRLHDLTHGYPFDLISYHSPIPFEPLHLLFSLPLLDCSSLQGP